MRDALFRLLVRLALAAVVAGFFRVATGMWSLALVLASPLIAAAAARPLLELAGRSPQVMRHLAWRDVAGRHHAFRGRSIDVHVDERGVPWLSEHDVRRCVPGLPAVAVLQRLHPAGCAAIGPRTPEGRITAGSLAEALARTSDPGTGRFLHWLERDVARPARRRQAIARGEAHRD